MDIGPLRIETGFIGSATGDMWYDISWSPSRRRRNKVLDEAAAALEKEAKAIIRAGDQFDQGGDIYSKAGYLLDAANTVRNLKQ